MTLIAKYQKILGLTTYKLAREIGIEQTSLKRIRDRETMPSIESYYAMVKYFSKQDKINFSERGFLENFFEEK